MPQEKRIPPPEAAERLIKAVEGYRAARIERDQAIAAALNAGGSTRQVGEIAGLSQTQARDIGLANGYPDAQLTREREKVAAKRAERDAFWTDIIEAARVIREARERASEAPGPTE